MAQSLIFCVMIGRLLVGFVWLNLVFLVMVGRFLVGFVWLNILFLVLCFVDFLCGSRGALFILLCAVRSIFSGVREVQSFVFCVKVFRLLVGFLWFYLQFSESCLVDF